MDRASRRDFLLKTARWGTVLGGAGILLTSPALRRLLEIVPVEAAGRTIEDLLKKAPEARYWIGVNAGQGSCSVCHGAKFTGEAPKTAHKDRSVKCLLCAHACLIPEGERGRCRARMNVRGRLYSLVYGRPLAEHVDPIEKKPFYHFLPGAAAYSLATAGCPLSCRFCQNWEISQARPEDYAVPYRPPGVMANRARARAAPVIAFTYNEPTVFTEYLLDIAREGKKKGIRCVIVSCGFMQERPLADMIAVLDAVKIDLKGFSPDFYRRVTHSELAPVLRSIRQVAKSGRHLEIVNLVVPTLNDSPAMLRELSKWVAGELGPDIPVHFTRFHPDYQLLNLPATPVATLERAREAAMKEGVRYAYVGNVPGHPGNHTYCPKCGAVCIERSGFLVTEVRLKRGGCPACKTPIAGVWA
jgi:pyruvate formate lyase activating enzyme